MRYSKWYNQVHVWRSQLAGTFSDIISFRPNRLYLLGTIVLQAVSWWLASYIYRHLSSTLLVLHYNVDFGIDWVGDPKLVFYLPLFGILAAIIALIWLLLLGSGKHFRLQAHYLLGGTFLANLGWLAALVLVYLINFR